MARDILVDGQNFPCPITATVEDAEKSIRTRFGLQFGVLQDEIGALINSNTLIGTAVGTISFVGGHRIIQGKLIADGLPLLRQTITSSSGSVPPEHKHRPCNREEKNDFVLESFVPESVWNRRSRVWDSASINQLDELEFSTEADLHSAVNLFLEDIIKSGEFPFKLSQNLSIQHITPGKSVIADGKRLVGVVEVKMKGYSILTKPTVLGELFDQMLLIEGFYESGPVIGILTTFEEWLFVWFKADHSYFSASVESRHQSQDSQLSVSLTPLKAVDGHNRYSLQGQSPSPTAKNVPHGIQESDTVDLGESVVFPEYHDRLLCTTRVLQASSNGRFGSVVHHIYTAFVRMSCVQMNHKPLRGISKCLFQLHKGATGITWHLFPQHLALQKVLSNSKSPMANDVKHLLALKDLGRGSSGKAWLMSTVTLSSICVLKFHNKCYETYALYKEKTMWDLIYPEFQKLTSVDEWSGSLALRMPHFIDVPEEESDDFRNSIFNILEEKFLMKGLVHGDVRWRNIGYYVCEYGQKVPVLYDLESVEQFNGETHNEWIEEAMLHLYPTRKG